MKTVTTAGILAALGLAGCAAYGGETMLSLPIQVIPSRSVTLRTPDAIRTATGTRFHGSVCRSVPWMSLTRIRIERLGAGGAVVDTATRPLSGLGGRGPRCTFYDVATDWTVGSGEQVRVCAGRSDAPCMASDRPSS